jgi:hypothetical protein
MVTSNEFRYHCQNEEVVFVKFLLLHHPLSRSRNGIVKVDFALVNPTTFSKTVIFRKHHTRVTNISFY